MFAKSLSARVHTESVTGSEAGRVDEATGAITSVSLCETGAECVFGFVCIRWNKKVGEGSAGACAASTLFELLCQSLSR